MARLLTLSWYDRRLLAAGEGMTAAEKAAYRSAMKSLLQMCHECDAGVYLHPSRSFFRWTDGGIRMQQNLGAKTLVHVLLHEIGHLCVGLRLGDYTTDGRFSREVWRGNCRGTSDRLIVLDEEIEAWHIGREIINRHGFQLDFDGYQQVETQSLKSYVGWVARNGRQAPKKRKKRVR